MTECDSGKKHFILGGLRIFLGERVPRLGLYKGRSDTRGFIFHFSFVICHCINRRQMTDDK